MIADRPAATVGRRILLVVAEDAWFWTHRLPLARAARDAGFEVGVVTNREQSLERMRQEGFAFFVHDFRRAGIEPGYDLRTVARLARLYAAFRPALVHHVAMKPVLFGSLAARWAGVPAVVNALAGLGFSLTSTRLSARLLRPLVGSGLRHVMAAPNTRLIVQNRDDADFLVGRGLVAQAKIRLVRGVGVCLRRFAPSPQPEGVPLVVLPGRLLRDKGVPEFVCAARHIRRLGEPARFALVGGLDVNPASLTQRDLDEIKREGVVEVWGHRDDMPSIYQQASIVCLPSYREGLPKALLEAAASARPIVATDVPGCREVVRHGENGMLVPPRSVGPLANALLYLIRNRQARARFGAAGRALVEKEFTIEKTVAATFAVYAELLGEQAS
ncbi:MAG: glycosyltransferase family 4 protein [Burkholderiaceae bacterium]|nr:glycosyltransferase family 4 protein [Burkholderiaceae bacterium]